MPLLFAHCDALLSRFLFPEALRCREASELVFQPIDASLIISFIMKRDDACLLFQRKIKCRKIAPLDDSLFRYEGQESIRSRGRRILDKSPPSDGNDECR